ncbi:MAG: hypothetical protein RLZZ362_2113 [Actinomycetota bacterium]
MSPERSGTAPRGAHRDEGAALVLALVMVVICSFIAVPVLGYANTVSRQSRIPYEKLVRAEAAKAGLRTALLNPVATYATCSQATIGTGRALPTVDLGGSVTTTTQCFALSHERREPEGEQRIALASTQVGTQSPAQPYVVGSRYTPATASSAAWVADRTTDASPGAIWLPKLPQRRSLPAVSPTGYSMPGTCRAFLPGIYDQPVTITGSNPVYFASGVYYFRQPVTFGRNVDIVVGEGAVAGCTTDLQAATTAHNGPAQHQVSGGGATFVFGASGRLIIDDSGTTGSMSVVFNQRYASAIRQATDSTKGISIMSVNGASGGEGPYVDGASVFVPLSEVFGPTPTTLASNQYVTSTVTAAATPIVSVALTSNKPVVISIPGYVAVPQGTVGITTTVASEKQVTIGGGVLARTIDVSSTVPASFELGITNPIDIYSLRIVSTSSTPTGTATSTATVRVRYDGLAGITGWEVRG